MESKKPPILPLEMRILRKNLEMSLTQMAAILGLSGDNAKCAIRRIEEGTRPATGPVQRIARQLQQATADALHKMGVPEYVRDNNCLVRLQYPRFIATIETSPNERGYKINDGAWLVVKVWIDDPLNGTDFINKAVEWLTL